MRPRAPEPMRPESQPEERSHPRGSVTRSPPAPAAPVEDARARTGPECLAHARAGTRTCSRAQGGFPSGQRGQTVNLMAKPSQVRILFPHHPPSSCRPRSPVPPGAPVRCQRLSRPLHLRPCGHRARGARGRSSMVERQPSKLNAWVRFPSPAPPLERRVTPCAARCGRRGAPIGSRMRCCCSSVVEHFLGKEEVMGSSPISSSTAGRARHRRRPASFSPTQPTTNRSTSRGSAGRSAHKPNPSTRRLARHLPTTRTGLRPSPSQEPAMAKEVFQRTKPHCNVGTIGHVDHGKTHADGGDHAASSRAARAWPRAAFARSTKGGPRARPRASRSHLARRVRDAQSATTRTSIARVTPTTSRT